MSADGVQCELERLLVVDDEGPILHALQRTFEAAGYDVTACLDPAEALDRLKERPYQVLSADYMMPGMTGAEFLARARVLQPETIRILITAAHDFSAAVDAINNGEIFRILAKPWNRVELLGTVRQAFDTYALREKNRQLTALVQRQNGELADLNKGLEKLVQERTTAIQTTLLFFELEWAALSDERAEALLAGEGLDFCRHHLRKLRRYRDHLLSEPEEKILAEKALTGASKPGPLDQEEWVEMREHPRLGWALLQRIEFLREASEIVLQHQERFDGSGYPAGLKGESIVLGARLFAVADTYDAITSDRPYRRAQPHAAAVAEIQRVSNTQLDPRVVGAFCSVSEADWLRIRGEVEQISLLEAQWGWTPPKRVFDLIHDASQRQKLARNDPPPPIDLAAIKA